ncbi:flagellar basal body L-ring protein FlgH [Brevundimonas aveniformis]|uniref:flagellar basal body L-ring protein FlgH n=1 Tax=Brevundimonas aveniformis TaxID=370977 RepID=UPI000423474E|nr:flagellar basal body L-ring protein FlgH [Brevundimonas aveniformis]
MSRSFALIPLLLLGACSTVEEAVRGPDMSNMGYPAALMPLEQPMAPPPQPASAGSLWRAGSRSFFRDQRARNVGDILTVNINIDDRASLQNSTQRDRSSETNAGVGSFFGLENALGVLFPDGFDADNMVEMQSGSSSAGSGTINRAERVSLTIAAVVTAVLPNGNLVIQGRQEVRTNRELRELLVSGIVRPNDISSENTIDHTQIAEARISYGGRGDVSRVQSPPAGQSVVERFSPF